MEEVSLDLDEELIYDKPINCNFVKNHQVKSNLKEENIFLCKIEQPTKNDLEQKMSKLYFNGNLKVIDYLNWKVCDYSNINAINYTFTYPSE